MTPQKIMSALHFDVPGWTVPVVAPAQVPPSKKRKRPSSIIDVNKIESAKINLDKLLDQLQSDSKPAKKPRKKKQHIVESADLPDESSIDSISEKAPAPIRQRKWEKNKASKKLKPGISNVNSTSTHGRPPRQEGSASSQKSAKIQARKETDVSPKPTPHAKPPPTVEGLTPLQIEMRQKLGGARFRCVVYATLSVQVNGLILG